MVNATRLDYNNLGWGNVHARQIALLLPELKQLTYLDLSRNWIGPEGSKAIAEALKSGTSVLTSLNLYDNSIGPEGGKAIAEALKSGTSVLTTLNLYGNNLGDAEQQLLDAVKGREGFELE